MSGWLILWLAMVAVGFFVFLGAAFSTFTHDHEMAAAVIGTVGFLVCLAGILGGAAWLLVRMFG